MKQLSPFDLRLFVGGFLLLAILLFSPTSALAISLDSSFGTGGKFTLDFGSSGERNSTPFWAFRQPSGRLVLAGDHWTGGSIPTNSAFAMAGVTQQGALNSTFGSSGKVLEWDTANTPRIVYDLQALPSGKFLRLESIHSFPSTSAGLVRLNADGTHDSTFSANINVAGDQIRPWKIAVLPNGKIYVLVGQFNGSTSYWLVRLNVNGTRDTSFGTDGVRLFNLNRLSRFALSGMHVLEDGRLILGGAMNTSGGILGGNVLWMARFDENGYLDRSFGNQGIVRRGFSTNVSVSEILVQTDGKYILVGSSRTGNTESKLLMMRLTPRGRPDVGFGTNGVVESNLGSPTPMINTAYGGAILGDGRIFVVGGTSSSPASESSVTSFLVARFSASGILEDHTSTQFTNGLSSLAYDAIAQPDDKLVVTGYTRNPDASANGVVFAAARYIP